MSAASSSVRIVLISFGESFAGRPLLRPRARAALRPATVLSRIRLRSGSARAAKTWKTRRPVGVLGQPRPATNLKPRFTSGNLVVGEDAWLPRECGNQVRFEASAEVHPQPWIVGCSPVRSLASRRSVHEMAFTATSVRLSSLASESVGQGRQVSIKKETADSTSALAQYRFAKQLPSRARGTLAEIAAR